MNKEGILIVSMLINAYFPKYALQTNMDQQYDKDEAKRSNDKKEHCYKVFRRRGRIY